MPYPGDKLYRIHSIRCGARQEMIQVEFHTFVVDGENNNVSTGVKAVRIPWDQDAFDALKASLETAVAADPSLIGFDAI